MIGLVYLLWPPLGPEPLREFLRSYHAHQAGAEHELVVILNRPEPGQAAAAASGAERNRVLLTELDGTGHRLIATGRPLQDLAAYGEAARQIPHTRLCFLNSYSVVLAEGWLAHLSAALDQPGVELAGASGSWESQAEWIRGRARYWPYQLACLRTARRDYPRFPNPHIRTTGFAIARHALLQLGLERACDKHAAYLLESGRASITRRVLEDGRRVVVVGRDGHIHDVGDWPRSRTYRGGGQENLLVADKRTREWAQAPPRLRRRLARDAWGERGVP